MWMHQCHIDVQFPVGLFWYLLFIWCWKAMNISAKSTSRGNEDKYQCRNLKGRWRHPIARMWHFFEQQDWLQKASEERKNNNMDDSLGELQNTMCLCIQQTTRWEWLFVEMKNVLPREEIAKDLFKSTLGGAGGWRAGCRTKNESNKGNSSLHNL